MQVDRRKADTQRKIQLGGLIIKAGISERVIGKILRGNVMRVLSEA